MNLEIFMWVTHFQNITPFGYLKMYFLLSYLIVIHLNHAVIGEINYSKNF